jgi:carbonic anhydrase
MKDFGTVLTCMDGRIQRKVSDYLVTTFGVRNVDTVTAAGMVKHVASDTSRTQAILGDLDVSVSQHGSRDIAVVAHHDCAGNPAADTEQKDQVAKAVARLMERHPGAEVVGIFLDRNRTIERVRATR